MSWKPTALEPGDLEAAGSLIATVFGRGPRLSPDTRREFELATEADRMFLVHDGPAVVGIGGAYTFGLALPGGATLPMCGVTEVGVAPTHRRRGMLRSIMAAVIDQAIEREEPIAGLTASDRQSCSATNRFRTVTSRAVRSAAKASRSPGSTARMRATASRTPNRLPRPTRDA